MLDTKRVGTKIIYFRKKIGYTQEKLADKLCISPQAVSRWENGHTLPDTQMLPVLAQLFGCTIDEIIMPAYSFDEKIKAEKSGSIEKQAENIAQIIIQKMGDKIMKNIFGLNEQEIISAVKTKYPDVNNFEITKSAPEKSKRCTMMFITVKTTQIELKLIEKVFMNENDNELRRYHLLNQCKSASALSLPNIYLADMERKVLLMEDLSGNYFKGNAVMWIVSGFDKGHEEGLIYKENLNSLIRSAAEFHSYAWENQDMLNHMGLPWHFESKENMFSWIDNAMVKPLNKYKANEKAGKIPKQDIGENNITPEQFGYFEKALEYVKTEFVKLIEERFAVGKNITVIQGDLHPGNTFMSKSVDRTVKFIDLEACRIGLCTEDLAMLFALHIEPNRKSAEPMLNYYYECLSQKVSNYSYESFVNDYKLSIAENMFFVIRLLNRGIFDFLMRDRAIRAFETFVLDME